MTQVAENKYVGDFLVWMANYNFNLDVGTIKQDSDATEGLYPGQVLEDDTGLVVCTSGGNAEAILCEVVPLADLVAGNVSALVLVRGPAVVNKSQLTIDGAQLAAAVTALAALGIKSVTQPTTTTQST